MMRNSFLLVCILCPVIISAQNYTILGNASALSGCNCFQLTPDANDQGGAIYQNQTINLNNSFDFTFSVFLGCRNGNDAADGIAFVLTSNPNGLGLRGEYLGYGNGSNQPYSIAVEFDTWENGNHGDPSYDHIAIESGGSVDHTVTPPVPAIAGGGNIDNCQWYIVRIVWDVNTSTYSIYFNGVLIQQIVNSFFVQQYFGGNPIVNWGWSGATGGGTNDQRVCVQSTSNWVAGINYQSCDLTLQFNDISTSNLGTIQSWAWSFGDNTTSNLQNPVHTYAATGSYPVTLTITDISGCTNTYSHDVTINPPITLTPTLNEPPCNGGSNGAIYLGVAGGFGVSAGYGGFQFNWNGGVRLTQDYPGAAAGTYTVSVTDGVCSATGTYTLDQPPPLTATTSHTDATCGNNDGTASIVISGGTPPYSTVNWGAGGTGTTVVGLPMGVYVPDFTDFNGCTSLLTYREIVNSLPCGITSSASSTNVTCFGLNDGTATLNVTGGSPPATITWSTTQTGTTITGLAAGTYSYTYTDQSPGNTFSGSVTVNAPGAAMTVSLSTINMTCDNTNDGQALASVLSGGNPPYNYAWTGGHPNQPSLTGLSPGAISVVITDNSGCTATASGNITGPPTITLNITTVDDSCYQSKTGSATANVSGGNPPYTFFWSNISSAQTNLNMGIGNYTVTVTDSKGCTISGNAAINEPAPFTHTLTSQDIDCFGNNNGSILVTATGGTQSYNYLWNPSSATGSNPLGLSAGEYHLTLTDANNCRIIDSVTIIEPLSALNVISSHTDVTCYGADDGTITLDVSGGTAPYNYLGNPLPAGITIITGLVPNTYSGNVLDANGCSVAVSETIIGPAAQSLTLSNTNVSCNGATDATADADFVNPAGSVTYSWTGDLSGAHITGLAAGDYDVTATDGNGCSLTGSVTVTEPPPVTMLVTVTNAWCFGGTGTATAQPAGAGPFTYSWSASGTAQTINPPAGNHSVTATDANSCNQIGSFTITEPPQIIASATSVSPICFGDATGSVTVVASGGTPGYSYTWSPAASTTDIANGIPSGDYSITVTDASSCAVVATSTVNDPPAVIVDVTPQPAEVQQGETLQIAVTTNQSDPLIYTWLPQTGLTCYNCANPVFNGLTTETYTITVETADGCEGNAQLIVTVTPNADIFIPNAFSPNGDGENDYFELFGGLSLIDKLELKIFDRWGDKLFESASLLDRWDGTYHGKKVNPGVYVYTIRITWRTGHADSFYKGSLTVVR